MRKLSRSVGSVPPSGLFPPIADWIPARLRDTQGSVLTEMAIVLPVFLLIMTGILSVGIAFSNQLILTQAVGSGAQYLQMISATTTDPCQDTFNAIKGAAPSLNASSLSVTVTMNGDTPSQAGNSCAGSQSLLQTPGIPIKVAASYPCNISVYGVRFSSTCQLTANVTEYEY